MSDDLDVWVAAELARLTIGDVVLSESGRRSVRILLLLQEHRAALRDMLLYIGDHEVCGRNEAPCPVLQARKVLAGEVKDG